MRVILVLLVATLLVMHTEAESVLQEASQVCRDVVDNSLTVADKAAAGAARVAVDALKILCRPESSYVYTYNPAGQVHCASCDRVFKTKFGLQFIQENTKYIWDGIKQIRDKHYRLLRKIITATLPTHNA